MERKDDFVDYIQKELQKQVKYNKTSLEKIAASFGIIDLNHVKEYTELAIVNQSRKLAHTAGTVKSRFESIVELYRTQVNLSHRTSQSMLLQQYSTPAPIGYIAGVFCGMDKDGFYFEPSAGNGLLTIASIPQQFMVNEIDDVRRSNLESQHFFKVLNKDATTPFPYSNSFDAIITNPPFGKLDNDVNFNGYSINTLDHLMCIRALDTMKDTGRAALIIGGHTTWDERGRIQSGKNRIFFSYLHEFYNVIDCINIDGHKLYSRQGTSFDVRLILIDGRKVTPGGFAPLFNPGPDKVVSDFNALYERVIQYKSLPEDTDNSESSTTNIFELEALALQVELDLLNFDSLGKMDEEMIDKLILLYEKAQQESTGKDEINFANVTKSDAEKIKNLIGIDLTHYKHIVSFNDARHIYKMHGKSFDKLNNQKEVGAESFALIPIIIKKYDSLIFQPKNPKERKRNDSLLYEKLIGTKHYVVEEIWEEQKELRVKTMYIKNR